MNIPGVFIIEKTEASNVDLPMLSSGQSIVLEDYLIGALSTLDFITDTSGISVDVKKSDAGDYFVIEVPFKIAGYDSAILEALRYLKSKPHVWVITEKSGEKYLIGSNNDPKATVDYKVQNDPNAKGGRGVEGGINWKTTKFPIFIIPDGGVIIPDQD